MTTPLEKTLKRALNIKGRDYVVSLSPESVKLMLKGHRLGVELKWADLVNGEAALATALQASLGKFTEDKPRDGPARPHEQSESIFQHPCGFRHWPALPIHVIASADDR
jgi:hypothetical protein